MSEEVKRKEYETECSICGFVPGPVPTCNICHGNIGFIKKRQYTLTEERQGTGNSDPDRYGPEGDTNPRIVVVPGSYDPSVGTRKAE
jgi:hypothetical protein